MAAGAALHLYLLTEDDSDDQVFHSLLEMMTDRRMELVTTKFRKGGGIGEVRKKLPLLLKLIERTGAQDNAVFVITIDNDRALEHPAHQAGWHGGRAPCRYCALQTAIHAVLVDGFPIPGAIAVPVQMIEAWLLLMHDPTKYARESDLPICARSDQSLARRHYGKSPPPQLKDLVDGECKASGSTRNELALQCIVALDANALAERASSFALFREQVEPWRKK